MQALFKISGLGQFESSFYPRARIYLLYSNIFLCWVTIIYTLMRDFSNNLISEFLAINHLNDLQVSRNYSLVEFFAFSISIWYRLLKLFTGKELSLFLMRYQFQVSCIFYCILGSRSRSKQFFVFFLKGISIFVFHHLIN